MPDPLRIAMISYYLPGGSKIGVGYQVHELANELVRRGHVVDVYSNCPPGPNALYGHRLVALRGNLRTFRFATALRRMDFSGYDVLHAHGDDYWMWRRRAKAHVRTLHGSCFDEALHITGFVARLRMVALGFSEVLASVVADATVAVSPATRRWTPWVRRVITNGVDSARFASTAVARAEQPVVLFVGTWAGRKRGELLVRTFTDDVLAQVPYAQLWMVSGDVPNGLSNSIRVLGRVSNEELVRCYQQAWIFCLPSSYEGFGIPYVEAMAAGLPVVATPNSGARFVTADGRVGALVADDELGAELVRLLSDSDARQALAQAGTTRAAEFSLSKVAEQYEQLYRETIATRTSR